MARDTVRLAMGHGGGAVAKVVSARATLGDVTKPLFLVAT